MPTIRVNLINFSRNCLTGPWFALKKTAIWCFGLWISLILGAKIIVSTKPLINTKKYGERIFSMTHENLRTLLLYTLNGRTSKKLPFELLSMRQKTTRFKCLTANHIKLFLVRIHLMKKKVKVFEAIFADGGSLINCSIICWILASIAFYGRKIMVGTCWSMILCLKYASILCLKNSLKLVDVTSRKNK